MRGRQVCREKKLYAPGPWMIIGFDHMAAPEQRDQGPAVPLPSPGLRVGLIFVFDALIAVTSLWLALMLRFDGHIEQAYAAMLPVYVALLIPARLGTNFFFGLHRWSFRLSGLPDGARIAFAGLLGTGIFVLSNYLLQRLDPPRSVVVLELLLTTLGMAGLRFAPRLAGLYWTEMRRARRGNAQRTLIVGAGAAGEMLVRDLQRSGEHNYQVLGFVDDNPQKWSAIVAGRRILGGVSALPSLIDRLHVTAVIVAVPRFQPSLVRHILKLCDGRKVQLKVVPASFVYFQERGAANMLQDLSLEDLLSRPQVTFGQSERPMLRGRRVLVTGAAGSIGSEICRQLLDAEIGQLVAVDINENGLYRLEQELRRGYPSANVSLPLADLREARRVERLMRDFRPQDVFHAAAHKHVPMMEASPCEAIKNNVGGTAHVLGAAEKHDVECFVLISSDKAVDPSSVMGATKRIGEMMTRAVAGRSPMRCRAVRFGNVLGSDGSVVPLFRQQIAGGGPVTVTDPNVRRYFMTIDEAVGLVLKAAYGPYGELCVLDMGEPIAIMDLARHMITMAGLVPEVDIPIVVTGLRPGEKVNEQLLTSEEEVEVGGEGKIHVVTGPPPPLDLWNRVAELQSAAMTEDAARVITLLHEFLPSYRRGAYDTPAASA